MKLTISEIHFITRNLKARKEWIRDNPDDSSEEEGEKDCIDSVLIKLNNLNFELEMDEGK